MNTRFIDNFMEENPQFPENPEDSDLWKSIKQGSIGAGFPCTDKDAQEWARWHCNSMSFYALCRARGFIEFGYSVWFEKLLRVKLVSEKGFLKDKLKIANFFGFDDEFTELNYITQYAQIVKPSKLNPEKGYNIKVYANTGSGNHFMACYMEEGKLYLSDSSSRGIHIEVAQVVPKIKFQWLLEV